LQDHYAQRLQVIDDEVAAQLRLHARGPAAFRERREFLRRCPRVLHETMPGQIGHVLRHAMAAQVIGRGAQHDVRGRQRPSDQRGRLEPRRRRADRHVEALVDQLDHAVGERDVDGHLRKARGIVGDRAHHVTQPERRQRRHAQPPLRHDARRAHGLTGLVEFSERLSHALVILAPRLGGRDAARGAVQETRAELLLEMHHVLARHRGGQVHALSRRNEAALLDHLAKHFHAEEGIHRATFNSNVNEQESIGSIVRALSNAGVQTRSNRASR